MTEKVSIVAAIPEVRHILVQHQRSLTKFGNLVMEGRDIGRWCFPTRPTSFISMPIPKCARCARKRDLEAMKIPATQEAVAQILQRARPERFRPQRRRRCKSRWARR